MDGRTEAASTVDGYSGCDGACVSFFEGEGKINSVYAEDVVAGIVMQQPVWI